MTAQIIVFPSPPVEVIDTDSLPPSAAELAMALTLECWFRKPIGGGLFRLFGRIDGRPWGTKVVSSGKSEAAAYASTEP
jgi:hypothetical protein